MGSYQAFGRHKEFGDGIVWRWSGMSLSYFDTIYGNEMKTKFQDIKKTRKVLTDAQ